MTSCKAILSFAVLLIATAPLAQGTYTQIDDPEGSAGTYCMGIDNAGDIVGFYQDASGINHGFLLSGGTYTTIDYPGSNDTRPYGINDLGQIVGLTVTSTFQYLGFLYDVQTQEFTQINYPGSDYTQASVINDAGIIAGWYQYSSGEGSGFELVGSTYRAIRPPGTLYSLVTGITASGNLVGYNINFNQNDRLTNYLFKRGKYAQITIPGVTDASVTGVNTDGAAIVGDYEMASGYPGGFVYQAKVLQTLAFPGANLTYVTGVNTAGEVVGWFFLPGFHGFTWTPPADAKKK